MELRRGRASDAAALAEIEAACFPAAEAAAAEEIAARLKVYANHFYVLWDGARPVAFIDGMTTDEQDLRDEMYADASLHDAQGAWQMIFGLNTLPEYRRRGCAGRLIEALCAAAQEQGRRGVVLTCNITSVGTAAATLTACLGTASRFRRRSSRWPTCTTRW